LVQKLAKRIQVPVEPDLDKALNAWCEASGESRAAVCATFLNECAPVLHEMTKSLLAYQKGSKKPFDNYLSLLDRVKHEASQVSLDLESVKKGGSS